MKGQSRGSVHAVFSQRITELREAAREAASSLGRVIRQWWVPTALADRDLLHVPSLHDDAFDRNGINENYSQVVQSAALPGTVGDVVSLKLQADYNAQEERAFRLRHASLVRCLVHMHGRLDGHKNQTGVFGRVEQQAADSVKAGGV